MPNNYFQFKQFTVHQERCAMKVTTDSCLFGAWAAVICQQLCVNSILDIGAGTGLLSLMLAQKTNANIHAVEIDEQAAMQAQQNFQQSNWKKKLTVQHTSVQDFTSNTQQQFNFIITNPPFYEQDLISDNAQKNTAHHSTSLTLQTLVACIKNLLSANGYFAVLLPYTRTDYFLQLTDGFYLMERINVKQTANHAHFRSMLLFSKQYCETVEHSISIKQNEKAYTAEFITLLKDYYLYLN
jgi:tRNA1Val (adenine37-N6)-methyltransferase